MNSDPHRPRHSAAEIETQESLVDLLVAHVDRTYITAGQPGVISAVRDLFRGLSATALTDLVLQLGLDTEPVREDEAEARRPG